VVLGGLSLLSLRDGLICYLAWLRRLGRVWRGSGGLGGRHCEKLGGGVISVVLLFAVWGYLNTQTHGILSFRSSMRDLLAQTCMLLSQSAFRSSSPFAYANPAVLPLLSYPSPRSRSGLTTARHCCCVM
jgi:hypothetical protein